MPIYYLAAIIIGWSVTGGAQAFGADEPSANARVYLEDVKSILKERCYSCHGPLKQEANLRLDTVASMRQGGDSGAAIVASDAASSLLVRKIRESDESIRMPPEGKPLTTEQIASIERWIAAGADAPVDEAPEPDPREHWSFQVPVRPPIPSVRDVAWGRNPIDMYIMAEYERLGLIPMPEADPAILARRVYVDLIGMPPTQEELAEFLESHAENGEAAYVRLVDRLLDSPQYGERWGRHWMDVWRYSDWYGRRSVNDVRNSAPHIWRWRDWIVHSLNRDRSYAEMLSMMLAADELAPEDDSEVVATGFIIRNWYSLNYDTWMRDLVEHTGKAFLGVRLNCCLCHDHKYDPISQEDHFRFRAFFEPLEFRHDRVSGGPSLPKYIRYDPKSGSSLSPTPAGLARIYEENLNAETFIYRGGDARDIIEGLPPVSPGVPGVMRGTLSEIAAVDVPPRSYYPGLKPFVREQEASAVRRALTTAEQELAVIQTEYDAQMPSLRQKVDEARRKLAEAEQTPDPEQSPVTQIEGIEQSLWGHWRFEGTTDEQFLSDGSGHGHVLQRVTGSDPPVSIYTLPTTDAGMGALFSTSPIDGRGVAQAENSTTDTATPRTNLSAAQFHQLQNFAYLSAEPHAEFLTEEFTFETLLHIGVSAPDFNRVMFDLPGRWAFMHRGINDKSSEFRILYNNMAGHRRDIVTAGGEQPLQLSTGTDYYVACVMGKDEVTIYLRDLAGGELESRVFPRGIENQDFTELARPDPAGPLRIGNSDGTGRHVGLLDEIRYWNRPLTKDEIASLSISTKSSQLVIAAKKNLSAANLALNALETKRNAAQAKVEHGVAQLKSIESRAAADDVRYLGATGDATEHAKAAALAEKSAALALARYNHLQAEADLLQQQVKLQTDPQVQDAVNKAQNNLQTTRKALESATAAMSNPGETYAPFSPNYPTTSTGRRSALAEWIADEAHPRTSRVAVNHIWLRHFGRALVEPVNDIGPSAKEPTHLDLLNWLAVEFTENQWSMKRLHRLIVTSSVYRLASSVSSNDPAAKTQIQRNLAVDKDNRYYWMLTPRRLEAEIVRDSILYLSDNLDTGFGGPELDNTKDIESRRRSLYFTLHPEDGGAMPFLSLFDPPDPQDCYRRSETLLPQQALAMVNGELTQQCSRRLARRLQVDLQAAGKGTDDDFISAAFLHLINREPTPDELELCREFLAAQIAGVNTAQAESRLPAADAATGPASDPATRARESLIRTLFNHHEFITIH